MTTPVLSPVRWWRDDATRYITRGPQIVPSAPQPDPAWLLELLAPLDPTVTHELARMFNAHDPSSLHEALARAQTLHDIARERRIALWTHADTDLIDDIRRGLGFDCS